MFSCVLEKTNEITDRTVMVPGSEATTEETTTEAGPLPITASEQRWVQEMNELRRKMTRTFHQTRVYTNSAMTKLAKTYSTCLRSLRRAGDPGRFRPAAASPSARAKGWTVPAA